MKRVAALDLLRGYFLFVIAIDHLYRFPNIFEVITGRGQLWVTAAEGFFMISGLLVGYIYGPKILVNTKSVVAKIWKRAGKLYLISVLLTIGFTVWGRHLPTDEIKSGLWMGSNLWEMAKETLKLQYVYGWADFLVYYAVFMVFAPLAVWAAAKNKGGVVALVSVVVWLGRGGSFYLAWQLLFMNSIVVGYNLPRMEKWWRGLQEKTRKNISRGWVAVTLATVVMSVIVVFGGEFGENWKMTAGWAQALQNLNVTLMPWFDKNTLGAGRVVLAGLWFTTLFGLFRKYENQINFVTQGFWERVGRNSLLAYSLQAALIFPMNVWVPGGTGYIENAILCVVVLGVMYWVVWMKEQVGRPGIMGSYENLAEIAAESVPG